MKKAATALLILSYVIALSMQANAFDPLPPGCKSHCSNITNCQSCMSDCEGYINNYIDVNTVLDAILRRSTIQINSTAYDPDAEKNLELCWCSACCDYHYGGDSPHPCIYPCPCVIRNTTNETTTTAPNRNQRPALTTSLKEITDSVNYNLCYVLNLLWIVIPAIAALIIMWAGAHYMTTEEDPVKRIKARNTVAYALVGLLISLVACPAVDYLIVNTNITPFQSSCQCYEMMTLNPGVPPTLPHIGNVTTQPFIQTTQGVPTTVVRNGTTTTKSTTTSTTSTTLGCLGPCEEYQTTHTLPTAFDWRNVNGQNYMTGIRDQGQCGSCWAHSVCGSMEGTYNVEQCKPGENNMAEQDLVSCAYNGQTLEGCNGGLTDNAFTWVQSNGICQETCFPYQAADVSCSGKCSPPPAWKLNSHVNAGSTIDAVKAYLICHGPLSVASYAWSHAITLAGYDDNSSICQSHYGKPGCWIIKNSWGAISGTFDNVYHEGGYGYIPYTGFKYSDIVGGQYPTFGPVGITAP